MSGLLIWNINQPDLSIEEISKVLHESRRKLYELPISVILALISKLSNAIMLSEIADRFEGLSFFAQWLRRDNLLKMIRRDFGDERFLDGFRERHGSRVLAVPRGIVGHWVAGNVGVLPLFSLIQMVLCKNANILKVSEEAAALTLETLNLLSRQEILHDGKLISGKIITDTIAVVSFSSSLNELNISLSLCSDMRVVWGSRFAADGVLSLPVKEHGDTIIFGPKYSLGAFDVASIEAVDFSAEILKTVQDVVLFNQIACSSPHVYFFERSSRPLKWIMGQIKEKLEKVLARRRIERHAPGTCANIINARGKYFLDIKREILCSRDLLWTVLGDRELRLEDPVYGNTVFIKEIESLDSIPGLMNRNIQCVSLAVRDGARREKLATEFAYAGVDRLVTPGQMHLFDFPWDGVFPLSRAVRWVALK